MATPSTTSTISPELRRILEEHRREAARLRAKFGDPDEALSAFVREHFDPAALEAAAREAEDGASSWHDDDDDDVV